MDDEVGSATTRRRGGQCYYEQGSPLWSHASSRCPAGSRPEVSHTRKRVGSPKESVPPSTWIESGQTSILWQVSSPKMEGEWAGGSSRRSRDSLLLTVQAAGSRVTVKPRASSCRMWL